MMHLIHRLGLAQVAIAITVLRGKGGREYSYSHKTWPLCGHILIAPVSVHWMCNKSNYFLDFIEFSIPANLNCII